MNKLKPRRIVWRREPRSNSNFCSRNETRPKIKSLISAAAGAKKPARQRLHAIYFDTPNCDLWKHGFTLRVRANGKAHIQTVKRLISSSIHRDEWEVETDQTEPDFEFIKNTPLARLASKPSIRSALRPAFEVNVERTSYWLAAGGGVIEASFDRGAIEANGDKLGVREFELELKSGGQRALFNFARALVSQAPLHPSLISKSERGHLLAGGTWGRAAKGSKTAPCQRYDVRAGVPGNQPDLPTRFSSEFAWAGEARQCRGGSPSTRRDPALACRHGAF